MKKTLLTIISIAIVIGVVVFVLQKQDHRAKQPAGRPETSGESSPPAPPQPPPPQAPTPTPTPEAPIPNPSPSPLTKVTITRADAGFAPAIVTVDTGTTVVFANESREPSWPASNPHPIHSDYPEFDARRAIAPGGSYEFTFTRVGTWKYHDHLNPSLGGTIIVK